MNSYTDKEISFIAIISLSISVALLLSLVPFMIEQKNRLDKLEKEIVAELVRRE